MNNITKQIVITIAIPTLLGLFGWVGNKCYDVISRTSYNLGYIECQKEKNNESEELANELVALRLYLSGIDTTGIQQ